MKLDEFPKTPADQEWERLQEDARRDHYLVVQLSPHRFQVHEIHWFRWGKTVVRHTRAATDAPAEKRSEAFTRCEQMNLARRKT